MQAPHLMVLYTCASSLVNVPVAKIIPPKSMRKKSRRSELGAWDGSDMATWEVPDGGIKDC